MWRDRDLRRLGLARLVSGIGGEAAFLVGVLGGAAFELDAQAGTLALLVAVYSLAALAGAAAAGVLIDRFGPQRVAVAGEACYLPAALGLAVASSTLGFTVATALIGMLASTVNTAIATFPALLASDHRQLTRSNAGLEAAGNVAFFAGPAAGAVLVGLAGVDAVFGFSAVTSAVAVVTLLTMRARPAPARTARQAAGVAELRAGFAFAYRRSPLRFCLLVTALTALSWGVFGVLEPLFFREVLGTGAEAYGWVNAVFGIGLVAGAVLIDRLPARLPTLRAAALLTLAGGLGAIAYTATAELAVVTLGSLWWGVVLGSLLPVLRTLVQLRTPAGMQGRAMGALQAHLLAGQLLPLLIVPTLASTWGAQAVLVGTGAVVVALAGLALPLARRLDRVAPDRAPASEGAAPERWQPSAATA